MNLRLFTAKLINLFGVCQILSQFSKVLFKQTIVHGVTYCSAEFEQNSIKQ